MDIWLKYVRHSEVPEWEAIGWVVVDTDNGHHSYYSCIMEWRGTGEMMIPHGGQHERDH